MMLQVSAVVRELMAAGVTGDALVTALERMEQASTARSAAAIRQARYRERKAAEGAQSVTCDVTSVTSVTPKEIPPTPPKENNIYISPPTAREAQKGRGTRLPADFEPSLEIRELASQRGLEDWEIHDQFERFRDWANAATGQAGVKRDWQAAFRNWIKRAADDKQRRKPRHLTSNPIRDAFAEQRAWLGGDLPEPRRNDDVSSGPDPTW